MPRSAKQLRALVKPPKPVKKKNAERRVEEFARAYGSEERVEFVKSLPCIACGAVGFAENAHVVKGDGGIGYKASAEFIAPLCGRRRPFTRGARLVWHGCHRELHDIGPVAFQSRWNINLGAAAADTHRRWLAHTNRTEER